MRRTGLFFLFVVASLLLACGAFAEESPSLVTLPIDKNALYDVTYEVGNCEIDTVENIKILGMDTLGDKRFLVVRNGLTGMSIGINRDDRAYINLESVKAILPCNQMRPKKVISNPVNDK